MKITKLEQSGFIIEADSGYTIALDIGAYTPLDKLDGKHVDEMFVSHIHGDHFSPNHIRKLNPQKVYVNRDCAATLRNDDTASDIVEIRAGDTVVANDFTVTIFNADHGPNVSTPLAENFGFLITVDGQVLYFAGDMFYPSGIDVSALEVDHALLPVGGHYTFGPQEAYDFAKQFMRIGKIIPMHYERNDNVDPKQRETFVQIASGDFDCA